VSEQARDRYGRPLRGSLDNAFPGIPERDEISNAEAWSIGMGYLAQDLPFHAHEVFEQRWRCCPENERLAWQAIAQWAAALTLQARGNKRGIVALAKRAQVNLEACSYVPTEIDSALVLESLSGLIKT
jgi:hypothetical protein